MTSIDRLEGIAAEAQFLDAERARYEGEGFKFTVHPPASVLPDFLGSYRPDALAQKPGRNIAIEVKRRSTPASERSLAQIRSLFEGHPDWQLNVAFIGSDPLDASSIASAQPSAIRDRTNEIAALKAQGHGRAAFILAWSLLEAAMNAAGGEGSNRPRSAATVVQALAMNGYIEPALASRLRPLADLRNRIVHGDLTVEVSPEAVDLVLAAIEETLRTTAGLDSTTPRS